jgi:CRISPR-associated endoribonuclease Cas2
MSGNQTTCYIIAYDIPDDRRRAKVHKILCGFGNWTQFSLFECFLSKKELVQLKAKLERQLDGQQDHIRFYPLCAACLGRVETIGGPLPKEDIVYIV